MSEVKKCPKCNTEVSGNAKFCPSCGAVLEESNKKTATCFYCHATIPAESLECPNCHHAFNVTRCPNCQRVIPKSANLCPTCGYALHEQDISARNSIPQEVFRFAPENQNLVACNVCGNMIAKDAKTCPKCGSKRKKTKRGCGCITVFVLILLVIALFNTYKGYLNKVNESDTAATTLTRSEIEKKVENVSYSSLARNPDTYKGTYLELELTITQILTISSVKYYHVYDGNDEYVMTDCRSSQTPKLLEGDTINVLCEFAGTKAMERALTDVEVEVPFIKAYYIDIEEE
ncbi:MAG: zinc ribbon domain-containing protein [Lachnospiraceae bacterium]|nr:zinc ribbon domain-containing protein [Lachnospiraceae bacterium]